MKTHFIIQAYQTRTETGGLTDVCTVDVFAKTEEEALNKAKNYIKKEYYRVSDIIEK